MLYPCCSDSQYCCNSTKGAADSKFSLFGLLGFSNQPLSCLTYRCVYYILYDYISTRIRASFHQNILLPSLWTERKEKTTPFGVNLTRSLAIYQAAYVYVYFAPGDNLVDLREQLLVSHAAVAVHNHLQLQPCLVSIAPVNQKSSRCNFLQLNALTHTAVLQLLQCHIGGT